MDPNVGAGLPARRKYAKIFIRMKRKTSAWTLYDVENAAGIFFLSKSRPEWEMGRAGKRETWNGNTFSDTFLKVSV